MKKKQRHIGVLLLLAVLLSFCSCDTHLPARVDTLIAPPILFEEQNEIMQALKKSAGDNILLEYPGSGENRSAFLLFDLDLDGEQEVIAFYRSAGEELRQDVVHMNLLDRLPSGSWRSLCDVIGEAAGIDRVCTGSFSGRQQLIVGWELMREKEKTLMCYSLSGGSLVREYSATYIEFAAADFWSEHDGDELITLNYVQQAENLLQPTQHARLIVREDDGFRAISTTPLDSRVTGYRNCVAGKTDVRRVGYFLDGLLSAGTVSTQVLTVSTSGQLQNPLLFDNNQAAQDNLRKATLLSQDMDGDGIFEVPQQQPVVGYETVPESECLYKTIWRQLSGNRLVKSKTTYSTAALGIRITVPPMLEGRVTLRTDMAHSEMTFYQYEGSLEQSNQVLFSLRVIDREQPRPAETYQLLCNNEFTSVWVRLYDVENPLCPKTADLAAWVTIT